MSYRLEQNGNDKSIVIDGWDKGIAASPYLGIANIRNVNTGYYPEVAYVNYQRQASPISFSGITVWLAGSHSTNVSGNIGWTFSASSSPAMTNPVAKATSPVGLNYILDDSGQIFKQNSVNSSSYTILGNGSGRFTKGALGLAYWNNYLVVFGNSVIEFCGNGVGDSGVTSSNWNPITSNTSINTVNFTTNFASQATRLVPTSSLFVLPKFQTGDRIRFTTTGTLPSPLALNTDYYIQGIDTNFLYFFVSTTQGGLAVSLTDDGSGTHTVTDYETVLPIGNCTALSLSITPNGTLDNASSGTITSYVNPIGVTVTGSWNEATGTYNIVDNYGSNILAAFTHGSATVTFVLPVSYVSLGTYSVNILAPTATTYKTLVSKVDGNLYFANGRNIGRILAEDVENFDPTLIPSFVVDYAVTELLQPSDTVVDLVDLKSTMVICGNRDTYTWDYVSTNVSAPSPVGEQIVAIENLLSNLYILAGTKGNIYLSNGYSNQITFKIPDFIAGVFDPVWSFGGLMVHRSKLWFQLLAKNTAGTNLMAGIFSLNVSPTSNGQPLNALVMEAQNSYGITPATGATRAGVLIDNESYSSGEDSYYSAWSNGASTGGIDYNSTSLWQNFEPTIETDIIDIGTVINPTSLGIIEFKLDRPLATGDQIRMYWRPSLSDSYTLMGTTTTSVLSAYNQSDIEKAQWVQFKIQTSCAASSSSFVPLRNIRIHYT